MDLATDEMGEYFREGETALEYIKELSHQNFKGEICGFLGYHYRSERYVIQKEDNIAPDPSSLFLINPLNYLLFKDAYEMVAIFHSHIVGDENPSEFDIKMAENCCQPFLIYSLNSKKINIYTPENTEADVKILERIKAVA
jgi:proteasome lid subunit RPN8/RPN11